MTWLVLVIALQAGAGPSYARLRMPDEAACQAARAALARTHDVTEIFCVQGARQQ